MKPSILLVNPPIYDFSAYDFWLKPYGMLRVAGFLRRRADFQLFDFIDRFDPRLPEGKYRSDPWGRGQFHAEVTEKPAVFSNIKRRFKRFGLCRNSFADFLSHSRHFDYALVQTGMTYWYLGVREVVEEIRAVSPCTKIILGGVYATLCAAHARALGADLVVDGSDLSPLWEFLSMLPELDQLPLWDLYPRLTAGVLKLADGCPFRCTYCSVPQVYPMFHPRSLERSLAEAEFLVRSGTDNIVFYDDALLFRSEEIIRPFLKQLLRTGLGANFHTPNALNARFISRELAQLLVESGFKNIYLGFESNAFAWQKKTGGKVYSEELARAVGNLAEAGADPQHLHAYIIIGHPMADDQQVEESIGFANSLGIRVMLSEFSPIPGTPDGELCRLRVNLDEPLCHNRTAYTIQSLGDEATNRLKHLARQLNKSFNSLHNKDELKMERQAGFHGNSSQHCASRQGTFS